MSHHTDLQQAPQSSLDPSGPSDSVLLEDWAGFYDDLEDDLVFECKLEIDHDPCGVAVYRDRVVLDIPGQAAPSVMELRQITSWDVAPDGADVVVEVDAGKRQRTRLPVGYAGAIRVALHEVLGASAR